MSLRIVVTAPTKHELDFEVPLTTIGDDSNDAAANGEVRSNFIGKVSNTVTGTTGLAAVIPAATQGLPPTHGGTNSVFSHGNSDTTYTPAGPMRRRIAYSSHVDDMPAESRHSHKRKSSICHTPAHGESTASSMPSNDPEAEVTFCIKSLDPKKQPNITIQASPTSTINNIKIIVQDQTGIPSDQQRLFFWASNWRTTEL